jgi:hypothetical protein
MQNWVFDARQQGMNIELIIFGYELEQGRAWANAPIEFWIDTGDALQNR